MAEASIPSSAPKGTPDPYLDGLDVLRKYADWNADATLQATVGAIERIAATTPIDDSGTFVAVESLITALLAAVLRAELDEQGM